jgi:hypothetical protein
MVWLRVFKYRKPHYQPKPSVDYQEVDKNGYGNSHKLHSLALQYVNMRTYTKL